MKKYTCIAIIDENKNNILFCKRSKPPFAGLWNFVGGKIEKNESALTNAYRELFEETGISKKDVKLFKLMEFMYNISEAKIYVYYGFLKHNVKLVEEFQELKWLDIQKNNFHDKNKFAGNGNIGVMIDELMLIKDFKK